MSYIRFTPDAFLDEDGYPSFEFLSQYCQLPTTKKFGYDGDIYGFDYKNLKFPNIIKANVIDTWNILKQFPDLVEVDTMNYYNSDILAIGNLKSVNSLYIPLYQLSKQEKLYVIKKHIAVFNKKTLFIKGEKLKVYKEWTIGPIDDLNYKDYDL